LKSSTSIRFNLPGSDLECMVPRSVSGYKKLRKDGVLPRRGDAPGVCHSYRCRPLASEDRQDQGCGKTDRAHHITTLAPRIEVEAGHTGLFDGADQSLTGRQVIVKIVQPQSGKVIFVSEKSSAFEPIGGRQTVTLINKKRANFGEKLEIRLLDADDEEILDTRAVEFRVEMDEFDSGFR
jgi:hypothetical protein